MPRDKEHSEHVGGVPERLRQVTVETLPVEELYVLDIDSYIDPQEVICIDATRSTLMINKYQSLKPFSDVKEFDDRTIIFMLAWVSTSEGGVQQGLIADCRSYEGRFDVVDLEKQVDFSDQESAWGELDLRRNQVPIVGVIDDPEDDGTVKFWGDEAFRDAALYVASQVDAAHSAPGDKLKKATDKPKEKGKKSKKKK